MPLPDDFSPWEHLQSVVINVHNRLVREAFRDLEDEDIDITTPRGSLKQACLMTDEDSAMQMLIRYWLFYLDIEQGTALHPPLYTMPTDRYQQDVRFQPQITLYFREDIDDVEQGYDPIDAEVSFRVQNATFENFNQSEAMALARRIQSEFTSGGEGWRWKKGRVKLFYRDKTKGYQFSVNAFSEAEGLEVMRKVMSIQSDALDRSNLVISELGEAPPIVPHTDRIYGETRRLPRRRPVGYVRFRYAECHIWGIGKPITLVDLSLRRSDPLLRA